MERLTIKRPDGWHVEDWENGIDHRGKDVDRLAAYEDTGMEPEEIANFMHRWGRAVELAGMIERYGSKHIADLLAAEKDGRCAVLPCKAGDTVYCIDKQNKIVTEIVGYFYIDENNISMINDREDSDYDFGKTAFLTREAAEAALKAGDTP
ncbi:MAG: hypothetical protein WCT05_15695 [Lentisphaeria bacterium]